MRRRREESRTQEGAAGAELMFALRQNVIIQPGGRIEITSPYLVPGMVVEVIVLVDEKPSRNNRT